MLSTAVLSPLGAASDNESTVAVSTGSGTTGSGATGSAAPDVSSTPTSIAVLSSPNRVTVRIVRCMTSSPVWPGAAELHRLLGDRRRAT